MLDNIDDASLVDSRARMRPVADDQCLLLRIMEGIVTVEQLLINSTARARPAPRFSRAFVGSPSSVSTSAGRVARIDAHEHVAGFDGRRLVAGNRLDNAALALALALKAQRDAELVGRPLHELAHTVVLGGRSDGVCRPAQPNVAFPRVEHIPRRNSQRIVA